MPPAVTPETENLEEGCRVVPLHRGDEGAPLRIGLVVKGSPESPGGAFVLLRETADASVYLGAVTDVAGRIRDWLEIWVQNVDQFAAAYPAWRESASNAVLDARWAQRAEAFRALEPASFLATGWENAPPWPVFFDRELREPIHPPATPADGWWALCQDDALLTQKGLPAYSTSLARYLHPPAGASDAPFVPVTSGA